MSTRPLNAGCPRCGAAFRCGADAPGCACERIELGAETLAALRAGYAGCLCMCCLRELAAAGAATDAGPGPGSPGA